MEKLRLAEQAQASDKVKAIKLAYHGKTDLDHTMSYGNGVKNMAGVSKTGINMRLRITNTTDTAQVIYIAPRSIIAGIFPSDVVDEAQEIANMRAIFSTLGLPEGIPLCVSEYIPDKAGAPTKKVTIQSLNRDQKLTLLAMEAASAPFQITSLDQFSFNATTGATESTNNGNTVTHYNVSAWRQKKYRDLNLSTFQSAKDLSNNIVKVDFIKEKFPVIAGTNDLFAILVNANTRLDITLGIGARNQQSERLFRQVEGGLDMLTSEFPQEFGDHDCGCR